jgi:hypothetical protein
MDPLNLVDLPSDLVLEIISCLPSRTDILNLALSVGNTQNSLLERRS